MTVRDKESWFAGLFPEMFGIHRRVYPPGRHSHLPRQSWRLTFLTAIIPAPRDPGRGARFQRASRFKFEHVENVLHDIKANR